MSKNLNDENFENVSGGVASIPKGKFVHGGGELHRDCYETNIKANVLKPFCSLCTMGENFEVDGATWVLCKKHIPAK